MSILLAFFFFFFNDTATTEIYTLSLHDALPISPKTCQRFLRIGVIRQDSFQRHDAPKRILTPDRKSTRLNSSHLVISYAVFCLKKKKKILYRPATQNTTHTGTDASLGLI